MSTRSQLTVLTLPGQQKMEVSVCVGLECHTVTGAVARTVCSTACSTRQSRKDINNWPLQF